MTDPPIRAVASDAPPGPPSPTTPSAGPRAAPDAAPAPRARSRRICPYLSSAGGSWRIGDAVARPPLRARSIRRPRRPTDKQRRHLPRPPSTSTARSSGPRRASRAATLAGGADPAARRRGRRMPADRCRGRPRSSSSSRASSIRLSRCQLDRAPGQLALVGADGRGLRGRRPQPPVGRSSPGASPDPSFAAVEPRAARRRRRRPADRRAVAEPSPVGAAVGRRRRRSGRPTRSRRATRLSGSRRKFGTTAAGSSAQRPEEHDAEDRPGPEDPLRPGRWAPSASVLAARGRTTSRSRRA